jgi:hypothetical protein
MESKSESWYSISQTTRKKSREKNQPSWLSGKNLIVAKKTQQHGEFDPGSG